MTEPNDDLRSELAHRAKLAGERGITGGKTWPKDHDGGHHASGALGVGAGGSVAKTMPKGMTWPGGSKDAKPLATDPPVSERQRAAMFAAASGRSTLGIPKRVGEEFVGKR